MACEQWETVGLLYTSDELSKDERCLYEKHLENCTSCRFEFDEYSKIRNHFSATIALDGYPSKSVDSAILKACSNGIRSTNIFWALNPIIKRSLYFIAVITIAFIGVGYFTALPIAINNGGAKTSTIAFENSATISKKDSLRELDSINADSGKTIRRGNLNGNSIIPVDITQE